jgi:hypothetical protein
LLFAEVKWSTLGRCVILQGGLAVGVIAQQNGPPGDCGLDRSVLSDFVIVLVKAIVDKEVDTMVWFEAWENCQRIVDHEPKCRTEAVWYKPSSSGIDIDSKQVSAEALSLIALKSAQQN